VRRSISRPSELAIVRASNDCVDDHEIHTSGLKSPSHSRSSRNLVLSSNHHIMDCFHDFCLACDKSSTTGPYCSQACRLADLDRGGSGSGSGSSSSSSSLTTSSFPTTPTSPSAPSSASAAGSAYVLTPPFNFNGQKRSDSSESGHGRSPQKAYFMWNPSSSRQVPAAASTSPPSQRALTPSSSRTSLTSSTSTDDVLPTPGGGRSRLSQQARLELEDYFNSFEQAKGNKRRPSVR